MILTLSLILLAIFSYHQIFSMYFWQDDYTILYFAQSNKLFDYPYQAGTLLTRWLYSYFDLNTYAYFAVGLCLFILSTLLFRYFVFEITNNKWLSYLSGFVFASGYIGLDAMKMFVGTGIVTLPGLIGMLLVLIFQLKHLKTGIHKYMIVSLVSYVLTLEVAPHRHSALILVLIITELIFFHFKKSKKQKLFLNIGLYTGVAFLQLIIHPSKLILQYTTGTMGNLTADVFYQALNPNYWLNIFGSFGNLFIPSYFKDPLVVNLIISKLFPDHLLLLLPGVIGLFLSIAITQKKHWLRITMISILAIVILNKLSIDIVDKISIINGLQITVVLIAKILILTKSQKFFGLYFLVISFGSLLTFYLSKPDLVLPTYHRYLMTSAFIPGLSIIVLRKNKGLMIAVAFVLIFFNLVSTINSQRSFIKKYSIHARNIHEYLKNDLPTVEQKTLIQVNAVGKDLQFAVGDAFRVGTFPSEVSVAVNKKIDASQIFISESEDQTQAILSEHPDIVQKYVFEYDGVQMNLLKAF